MLEPSGKVRGPAGNDVEAIVRQVRDVLREPVEADGLAFDLESVEGTIAFDGLPLAEAIRRTFASRETAFAGPVAAFSEDFVYAKESQWRAFRRRGGIEHAPEGFVEVVRSVAMFLAPLASALSAGEEVPKTRTPPGPWH